MTRVIRFSFVVVLAFSVLGLPDASASDAKPTSSMRRTKVELEGVVNINTASAEQLLLLPGIGPSTVRRIIQHRKIEKFALRYHIMWVKGVGKKTYRKLKPHLTVQGATTLERRRVKVPPAPETNAAPPSRGQARADG